MVLRSTTFCTFSQGLPSTRTSCNATRGLGIDAHAKLIPAAAVS